MNQINPVAIVQKLLAVFRRRFDLLLLPALVLIPGSVVLLKKLPKKYKASTKLAIQEPQHTNPFLGKFTSPTRLKKRIMLLTNIVTSHKILAQLAHKDAKAKGKKLSLRQLHYAVQGLRRNIKIMYLGQGLVQLEYRCKKPKKCLDNINFVLGKFMRETLRPQQDAVRRSSQFLANQIKRLRKDLKTTESALTLYKQRHHLELPETFKIHLAAFTHARKQYTKARIELSLSEQRRDFLYQRVRFLDPVLSRLKDRRTRLRLRLARARSRYTNRHPIMRRLRAQMRRLERSIRRHIPKKPRSLKDIERSMRWSKSARVLYQDADTGAPRPGVLSPFERLQETLIKVAVLKKKLVKYKHKIGFLKKRMTAYPKRELRLDTLQREAKISQRLYVKLRALYEESLLRRELELYDSSKRVMVVEPALLPLFPTSPKKPIILAGGFAASLMLSIFLIAIAEISDQTIHDVTDASAALDVPVIGTFGALPQLEL